MVVCGPDKDVLQNVRVDADELHALMRFTMLHPGPNLLPLKACYLQKVLRVCQKWHNLQKSSLLTT